LSGKDITNDIPINVGNPGTTALWVNNAEDYDVAIGGLPFFLAINDTFMYRRATAAFRKDQFDSSKEPGEQSLTGWWLRSQSSFHYGTGIKFYDTSSGESIPYRFYNSEGVDVWTLGQATLLKNASSFKTGLTNCRFLQQMRYNGTDYIVYNDGLSVNLVTGAGAATIIGTAIGSLWCLTNDGSHIYWADSTDMYKYELSTGTTTAIYHKGGFPTITSATAVWVKQRLIAGFNQSLFELSPNASGVNLNTVTPIYSHPNPEWQWSAIVEGRQAIYAAGYNGAQSTIYRITVQESTGSLPTLTGAIIAADLPNGEYVTSMFVYLGGYIAIGTNRGVRIGLIDDYGDISYGPLVVKTTNPVYDFDANDRFLWAATSVNGKVGTVRIDLSATTSAGYYAYANDLNSETSGYAKAVGFLGTSGRLCFTDGSSIWLEDESTLRTSGWLQTGAIRYTTLEPKHFKFMRARGSFTSGSMDIETVDENGSTYSLISYSSAIGSPEVAISSPDTSREFISFKFTLYRDSTLTSTGPTLKGYQLKALPAVKRQRIIQVPVWCYDVETDRYNVRTGYEGRAFIRLQELEDVEANGDIINYQDFTTGERVQVLVENIDFYRMTPPDKRFDGFGGRLVVSLRTVL
jgi:hypothetical protein